MSTNDVVGRLDAAVHALSVVDLGQLGEVVRGDRLGELSATLGQVDVQLSLLANTLRGAGDDAVTSRGGHLGDVASGEFSAPAADAPVGESLAA